MVAAATAAAGFVLVSVQHHHHISVSLIVEMAPKILSLALAAALVGAAPLVIEPRATCYSGVYVIVGRGSTEDPGEGKPGAVADLVVAAIPDSASVAVNYPASIVDPPYPESVVDGIKDTIAKVQAYVDACGPSSKIALVGYSQGGNLMTDALAGGVDKPDPLTTAYSQYSKS